MCVSFSAFEKSSLVKNLRLIFGLSLKSAADFSGYGLARSFGPVRPNSSYPENSSFFLAFEIVRCTKGHWFAQVASAPDLD